MRSSLRFALVSLLAGIGLPACSDDSTATTTSATSSTSGGGGAGGQGGQGPDCPDGTHVSGNDCEALFDGFEQAPGLLEARDHHVTFAKETAFGTFLYVAAGVQDNSLLLRTVERAPINADGTLGAWQALPDLPSSAPGAGVALVDNTVLIIGGLRAFKPSTKVMVADIQDNGDLTQVGDGPDLTVSRFHLTAVSHGKTVYVIGGLTGDGKDNTPSVERAEVGDLGVGAFSETTPLPAKRSHHAAVVIDDTIYVLGGLTGDPAGQNEGYSDVLRSVLGADGTPGPWEHAGDLPYNLATHAAFAHAGKLYVLGGVQEDTQDADALLAAPLLDDGTLGSFELVGNLPMERAHDHQTPLVNGVFYSIGGAHHHISQSEAYRGIFH